MADSPKKRTKGHRRRRHPVRPPNDRGQGRGQQFVPTDAQREIARSGAAIGMGEDKIRFLIINPETRKPIQKETLRDHFKEEMDEGRARAHYNMGKSIYDQGIGVPKLDAAGKQVGWISTPNITAAIWFSKARMGWSEGVKFDTEQLQAIIAAFGGDLAALRAARAALSVPAS